LYLNEVSANFGKQADIFVWMKIYQPKLEILIRKIIKEINSYPNERPYPDVNNFETEYKEKALKMFKEDFPDRPESDL